MKIFMITYEDELCSHIAECFSKCGQEVILFSFPEEINTYDFVMLSETNRSALIRALQNNVFDVIFSVEYLHEVSVCANALGVIYLSWILYFPNPDLYRNSVANVCNAVFCCDSGIVEMLKAAGAENVFYLPGGAMYADKPEESSESVSGKLHENAEIEIRETSGASGKDCHDKNHFGNIRRKCGDRCGSLCDRCRRDCKFRYKRRLNNRYKRIEKINGENIPRSGNLYTASFIGTVPEIEAGSVFGSESLLADNSRGYADGMAHCQRIVYGSDMITGNIPQRIKEEILEKYPLLAPNDIYVSVDELISYKIFMPYVTAQERMVLLSKVCGMTKVYSDWKLTEEEKKMYNIRGYITDVMERQKIYAESKINLFTADRAMKNGIPHQCFDIMAAGGFLITNHQNDLAKHFTPGKELVVFEDEFDLQQKFIIYSHNEDERREIAERGFEKVKKEHLIIHRIQELLSVF